MTTDSAFLQEHPDSSDQPAFVLVEPQVRILCADDDPAIRCALQMVLTRSGYHVDLAADGLEAWYALNSVDYRLLITDNEMPGLTGLQLLRKMRGAGMRTPVLLISGVFRHTVSAELARLGGRPLLTKPFGAAELLLVVREALRGASAPGEPPPQAVPAGGPA